MYRYQNTNDLRKSVIMHRFDMHCNMCYNVSRRYVTWNSILRKTLDMLRQSLT